MRRGGNTSALAASNPRLAELRRLARRRSRDDHRFVIEGATLVRDAHAAGIEIEAVYVDQGAEAPVAELGAIDVAHGVIAKLASTVTPQPVVAVARVPAAPAPATALRQATFAVVCDHVSDPGNAGTLVRSAVAAGAQVIVSIGSVDAWSPKVVRASAGALFRVPVVELSSVGALRAALEGTELSLVGTRAGDGERYDQFAFDEPVALAFGNESHGLSAELSAIVERWVQIPMHAGVESLNVAMAATVLCFEVARQRRA